MVKYSLGILAIAILIGNPALAQNIPSSSSGNRGSNFAPNFSQDRQYMVYLKDVNLLPQVKSIIPDAFISTLDSGTRVIQVGRYNNQSLAQRQVEQLRASGISPEIATVAARVAATNSASPILTFEPVNTTPIATDIPSPPSSQNPTGIGADLVPLPGVPFTPAQDKSIEINRGFQSGINPSPDVPAPLGVKDSLATSATPVRNRYFVIVPSSLESVLQKARAITPTARMAVSERGTYVEVQGFPDRGSADNLTKNVRSQGLDARVIYF